MKFSKSKFRLIVFVIILFIVSILCLVFSDDTETSKEEYKEETTVEVNTQNSSSNKVTYNKYEEEETETETETAIQLTTDDEYLVQLAMAEAEGESTEGKALVILVVLNRVQSDEFPDTVKEVIFQRTGDEYQFSPVKEGGRYYTTEPNDDCYEALKLVKSGWNESNGALYFTSSKEESTWHSRNLSYLFKYGNHKFYK